MQKVGSNVATSQRRDLPTSGRQVNDNRSQQVATSRRRDFSTIFVSPSLKAKRGPEIKGIEIRTDYGTESRAAAKEISEEDSYFCIFLLS